MEIARAHDWQQPLFYARRGEHLLEAKTYSRWDKT
jgi:hypothetical protein